MVKYIRFEGDITADEENILEEYDIICHLRHCIVHRFGKLGSRNAIEFGLKQHKHIIEKPVQLDEDKMYYCTSVCTNTILVMNNFLFNFIMKRTIKNREWTKNFDDDKEKFEQYYNLFVSISNPPPQPTSIEDAYNELMKTYYECRKY